MSKQHFFITFIATLAASLACMYGFSGIEKSTPYLDIGYIAIGLFSIQSIVIYFMNDWLSDANKKVIFIQLIMLNMITKMLLSALLVYWYYTTKSPAHGEFILPFIAIYVIYTVFETYFMNKQATAK